MLQKTARTIMATFLSLMVAVSFYPVTAFADTDYEAAYNQAKANTQAAYTEWQNAVSDMNAKYSAWQTAKANYETAKAAITTKKNEMDKKHRILDYATRNAIDYLAQQAWNADYGTTRPHAEWYYNTASRMDAILNGDPSDAINGTGAWVVGGATNISRFKSNSTSDNTRAKNWLPYGITTSTSGNDNTDSTSLYQKYVYYNESYDIVMLNLDYFNEHNTIRNNVGKSTILVSPYLMMQSAVNAPINSYHNIATTSKTSGFSNGQNLASNWGKINASPTNLTDSDPFTGLYYQEKNYSGTHYELIISDHTHAGMACSWTLSDKVFEQDVANTPNATGYTVSQYRSMINSRVSSELSAYNNAVTAYNNAVNTAEDYADIRDDALYDYTDAQALAGQKETAYNNAVAAENAAYQAWQEWLANQNQGENTDPGNDPGTGSGDDPGTGNDPDPGTTPEPPVTPPANDSQVTGITATATSATSFKVTWNAVSGVDSYNVYVDNGDETKKYSASSNSRAIPNCVTNETYLIQVSTVADGEEGPKSNIYTFTLTYNTGGNGGGDDSGGGVNDDPSLHGMGLDSEDQTPEQVTGVTLTETPNNGNPIITVRWNSATNANKYYVYVTSNGNTQKLTATASGYQVKNCKPSTAYNVKVSGVSSGGTEGPVSLGKNITTSAYTPPAPPKPTVGTPSIAKTKVTAKSKKADIWFNGASNAKTYKVEIRRVYKLKGKKKIAVSGGWKAYNVNSPTKYGWVYKKKISAKQAKKYKGNANYKLTKSGKKYKLYHKEKVAPVTATKLTRKSIYQVRVTAYNGSVSKTSKVTTFTIK